MNICIELNARNPARVSEVILLPEDEVKLSFSSGVYVLDNLVISCKKGNNTKKYKTTGAAIDLSDLCTSAGRIDIEVSLVVGAEVVKEWRVEPLLIKEIDHSFVPIPEFEHMREEIATMKGAIRELKTIVENNEM